MNHYHVKVKFLDELKHGRFIEASSEEGAIRQFVDDYIYVSHGENKTLTTLGDLQRENEELKAELATLKAQIRGTK